jgi:hypothetical protein
MTKCPTLFFFLLPSSSLFFLSCLIVIIIIGCRVVPPSSRVKSHSLVKGILGRTRSFLDLLLLLTITTTTTYYYYYYYYYYCHHRGRGRKEENLGYVLVMHGWRGSEVQLIPSPHLQVLATSARFLPVRGIFRAISANESH